MALDTMQIDDLSDRDWQDLYEHLASTDTAPRYWSEWRTKTPDERQAFKAALLARMQRYERDNTDD
jgi:hypothetical protein